MIPVALRDRSGRLVEFAWVDDEDYPGVRDHTWRHVKDHHGCEYARRGERINGAFTGILMHREILGLRRNPGRSCDDQCDHINRNGLDNRRRNLRAVSLRENLWNKSVYKSSKVGMRGVASKNGRWIAQISVDGRSTHLGYFDTPEAAAEAYTKAKNGQRS